MEDETMNKMKKIAQVTMLSLGLAVGASSCQENDMMDYQLDGRVYFYELDTVNAVEVIRTAENYSFALQHSALSEDTLFIRVKLMGALSERDRTFRAMEVTDSTTAEPGKHYKLLDGVMKSGEYIAYLPVVLYRTPDTQEHSVSLYLRIADTPDLGVGHPDLTHYKITWADMLLKPKHWPYYFGTYSTSKYRFAIDVLGMTEWPQADRHYDGQTPGFFTAAQLQLFAKRLNEAYEEYKQTNGPIYVDDTADEPVEIHYSHDS